jgi:hypothetical protein
MGLLRAFGITLKAAHCLGFLLYQKEQRCKKVYRGRNTDQMPINSGDDYSLFEYELKGEYDWLAKLQRAKKGIWLQ